MPLLTDVLSPPGGCRRRLGECVPSRPTDGALGLLGRQGVPSLLPESQVRSQGGRPLRAQGEGTVLGQVGGLGAGVGRSSGLSQGCGCPLLLVLGGQRRQLRGNN